MVHNSIYSQNVKMYSGIAVFLVDVYIDNINAGMAKGAVSKCQGENLKMG